MKNRGGVGHEGWKVLFLRDSFNFPGSHEMDDRAKEDKRNLVGICGIYCGTCPHYVAPRIQDEAYLKETSRETGNSAEEIRCDGCLSERVYRDCIDCRHGFRRCAREKNVTWCFQCADFPCRRLRDFLDIHVVNGVSHHAGLIEELQTMKDQGIDAWIEKQEEAGRCGECGKRLYWYELQCSSCRSPIQKKLVSQNP
jgi:hypothetical protein